MVNTNCYFKFKNNLILNVNGLINKIKDQCYENILNKFNNLEHISIGVNTEIYNKIQSYVCLKSDLPTTLNTLRRHARNLSQCVMVRLSAPDRLFASKTTKVSSYVPFSVIFTYQVTRKDTIDLNFIEENYKKLSLDYLWNWAELICPTASWQTASWLLLQHDLIKIVTHLCQQVWDDERLTTYHELYEQLKSYIAILPDSSQDLLLLDYVVRQLRTLG